MSLELLILFRINSCIQNHRLIIIKKQSNFCLRKCTSNFLFPLPHKDATSRCSYYSYLINELHIYDE